MNGCHGGWDQMESHQLHGGVVDYPTIDPRLHALLEFSKELYVESHELFKKVFPKLEEEISEGILIVKEQGDSMVRASLELLKELPTVIPKLNSNQITRVRTLQRSLSLESPRSPSMVGQDCSMKLQRFKVRTLVIDGVQPDGQGASEKK